MEGIIGIKKWLKKTMPQKAFIFIKKIKWFFAHINNKNKGVSQVFSDIYSRNQWGKAGEFGDSGEFYSGPGSSGLCAKQYCDTINGFIGSLNERNLRVVDLGCGDFRVGEKIAGQNGINYIGVDVVPDLIERNKKEYSGKNINFVCLDIISKELPDGDICLIRQVLQHLSNDEIKKIFEKISKYKYIFITESHPPKVQSYNKDKPHGPDTRIFDGSGVYLDMPPFNIPNVELVLSVVREEEIIDTYLIKNSKG